MSHFEIPNLFLQHSFDMAHVVKLQYLFIGLAGSDILASSASLPKRVKERLCFVRYSDLVKNYILGELLNFPSKPVWLNAEQLMNLNGSKLNGRTVWRVFIESKRFVTTEVNPLYRDLNEGETLLALSLEIREKLWYQQQIKRSLKRNRRLDMMPFDVFWEPNEWFLFLYCGVGGLHHNCFSEVVGIGLLISDPGFEAVV